MSARDVCGVLWEGSFTVYHSLALVNREITARLVNNPSFDVGLIEYERGDLLPPDQERFRALLARAGMYPGVVAVHVRHRWPPDFSPTRGRAVIIQPWEFGALPADWVDGLQALGAEVWAYSRFVRDTYIRSGLDPARVVVVPLGIDPEVFHPGLEPLPLPTDKSFRFLFVGGTIYRKGIDLLLQAYLQEFRPEEDVVLIVKDFCRDTAYRGRNLGEQIRDLQQDPRRPQIIYLDDTLSPADMARLYAAAHCFVLPYRGEGFGLPVLEAMACGVPPIVTSFGACLDFCHEGNALLVPATIKPFPENRVGDLVTVGHPFLAEPDVFSLRRLMRTAYEDRALLARLGAAGAREVAALYTWDHTVAVVAARLEALAADRRGSPARKRQSGRCNGKVENLVSCGVAHFNVGKLEEAAAAFQKALDLSPKNADAHFNLACVLAKRGDEEGRAVHLLRSLEADPGQARAYAHLGEALFRLGDPYGAREAWRQALRLDPSCPGAEENVKALEDMLAAEGTPVDLHEQSWFRRRLRQVSERVRASAHTGSDQADSSRLPPIEEVYRRVAHMFENPEEAKARLQETFIHWFDGCKRAIDIGCGKGTFLELLRRRGVEGEGIDLDPKVLGEARGKGLKVHLGSALEVLPRLEGRFDGAFLGHIIEHFPPHDAMQLLHATARVLDPGGIIVIQTPNFAHPDVLSRNFWLDLTHVRPYPKELLEAMLQGLGFEVLESRAMEETNNLDVIVVGRKPERVEPGGIHVELRGHFFVPSGLGDEARDWLTTLADSEVVVKATPIGETTDEKGLLEPAERRLVQTLSRQAVDPTTAIVIHVCSLPEIAREQSPGRIHVGRVYFETQGIPPNLVSKLRSLDEVWVASTFNARNFAAAGLDEAKVRVVHPFVREEFTPDAPPLDIPGRRGFNFLSVFDWSYRKGWEILLTAYVEEFSPREDVALVIKTTTVVRPESTAPLLEAQSWIEDRLGRTLDDIPDIIFLEGAIPRQSMPGLFTACDAFVLPSRGEGWGRPFLEAMACGLPVIGTRWGGHLDFMNDQNSYLIDVEEVVPVPTDIDLPVYRGLRWAQPSTIHLRKLMREVFTHREEARRKAERASREVRAQFSRARLRETLEGELQRLAAKAGLLAGQSLGVGMDGWR